jgi:hypothetical protein
MVLEDLYHRTKDDEGKTIVVKIRIPQIDARRGLRLFPHQYATTPTGFGKEPKVTRAPVNPTNLVGPTGGKPAMSGGVGVLEIVNVAEAEPKAPAA